MMWQKEHEDADFDVKGMQQRTKQPHKEKKLEKQERAVTLWLEDCSRDCTPLGTSLSPELHTRENP